MYAIAAVDENWGIGKGNKLLARVPEDLKNFSNKTKGNIIVVGRKTLESFKDGKPLKDRVNIVLSKNKNYSCDNTIIINSIDELIDELKKYKEDVYICGGETIYRQLLPYCDRVFITKLAQTFEADTYFPNLDKDDKWILKSCDEIRKSKTGIEFRFCKYERIRN